MCLFFSSEAFISPQESMKQQYLSPPLTRIFIPLWQWCSYSTVCVWYLRVSLLYVTDRFYGTFGCSTLLFFLSYQHLVTRSQEGAHTAKCILKIDAASRFENWDLDDNFPPWCCSLCHAVINTDLMRAVWIWLTTLCLFALLVDTDKLVKTRSL